MSAEHIWKFAKQIQTNDVYIEIYELGNEHYENVLHKQWYYMNLNKKPSQTR